MFKRLPNNTTIYQDYRVDGRKTKRENDRQNTAVAEAGGRRGIIKYEQLAGRVCRHEGR